MATANEIITDLSEILSDFNGRQYSGTITGTTLFMQDLGFTSIDVVVLGEALEDKYDVELPFGELITQLRDQGLQDVPIGVLARFLADRI